MDRTRRPLEAASLSSSCGMVSRFAAVWLRMQPVRSPVPPQSARAACPALPPDVAPMYVGGAMACTMITLLRASVSRRCAISCSQVHTEANVIRGCLRLKWAAALARDRGSPRRMYGLSFRLARDAGNNARLTLRTFGLSAVSDTAQRSLPDSRVLSIIGKSKRSTTKFVSIPRCPSRSSVAC